MNVIPRQAVQGEHPYPQVGLLKALTHPARLAILEVLRNGEECVCHMEAVLGHRQAYLSQQFAVLREAGIVEDRRDGWNIFYRVVRPEIYAVLDAVNKMTATNTESEREANPACPCPKCNTVKEK